MPMGHACIFADSMGFEDALLGRDAVNVHGTVATLGSDILVERVPGYTLNIMGVFGNLVDTFSCSYELRISQVICTKVSRTVYSLENSGSIICATGYDVFSSRTPG